MQNKETALQAILDQGLLPLFFHESPEVSLEVIRTLYRAGVRTLEYTNRGAAALGNFTFLKAQLGRDHPDLHLGIGTIKTAEEARAFIQAGADYIVCPVVNPEVGRITHEAGLLWIPGCFTPTEIFAAQQANAALVKVFPANLLGPSYISSIRDVFAGQLFMPTGGVELEEENIRTWFRSGVCAVGMGSKLISKEIMASRDYAKLEKMTRTALETIRKARRK
jgi:2-dehydro-3-deoxyphosphogluconate aldolase/(4S)-4-hydroxy-2-oxoglutarate aldolase